jgi:hypothetical protein
VGGLCLSPVRCLSGAKVEDGNEEEQAPEQFKTLKPRREIWPNDENSE